MAIDSSPPRGIASWYNLYSAMELSGYSQDTILDAIERGEIKICKGVLAEGGIRDKRSWVIIDRDSFQRWYAKRHESCAETDIQRMFAQVIRAIGDLRHDIHGSAKK